jgi:hypothetical protein
MGVNRVTLAVGWHLPVYPEQQTFSMFVGMFQRCHFTDACPVQSDLRSRFRSAFLRDCSVCLHNGIVESPTGNRAHTIETGEDA